MFIFSTSRCIAPVLSLLLSLLPLSGLAHTSLLSSQPADGQTLQNVKQIQLEYGAPLRLMSLTVTDKTGTELTTNFKRSNSAQSQFAFNLSQPISAGQYQVSWIAMGADGHKIDGRFRFTVDPAVTASDPAAPDKTAFSGLEHPAASAVLAFHQALKSGDTTAASALLAPDVMIFEGGAVERSLAEYQRHHMAADMAFMQSMQVEPVEHHVNGLEDSAVSLALSKISGDYKGKAIAYTSMETMTLQFKDGNWQITHIHWSK